MHCAFGYLQSIIAVFSFHTLLHVPHDSHIHAGKQMVEKLHNVQMVALQSGPCMGVCLLVCWLQQTLAAARVVKHAAAWESVCLFVGCNEHWLLQGS